MRWSVWWLGCSVFFLFCGAACSEEGPSAPMGGAGGMPECTVVADCDDGDECTIDACTEGMCENPTAENGFFCEGGYCQAGECEALTSLYPCTEEGILEAIEAGGGPHGFDCDGAQTITTTEEIIVGNDVILDGLGNVTVSGDGMHRVFLVNNVDLELWRLTVTDGLGDDGGGIQAKFGSTLTLASTAVTGNVATFNGGGIFAEGGGRLTLTDSTVSGNTANFGGGGIMSYKSMTLTRSTVSGNAAGNDGGGVWCAPGGLTLTVADSVVSGNTVSDGNGGGIAADTLIMTNSAVSTNSASTQGGGVFCRNATMIGSTLSENSANTDGGGMVNLGTVDVTNSTFSGNAGGQSGGGLLNLGDMSLVHVTMSNNSAPSGRAVATSGALSLRNTIIDGDCNIVESPSVTSAGNNIESPGDTCRLTQESDQVEVTSDELNLGALADNGGPTQTHALQTGENIDVDGSVAIDAVPSEVCNVDEDQRGVRRPSGEGCDVGAYELVQ